MVLPFWPREALASATFSGLVSCDFFLWGYLKDKVCEVSHHTLNELKVNIRCVVGATDSKVLHQMSMNMITCTQKCVAAQGGDFEYILQQYINFQ